MKRTQNRTESVRLSRDLKMRSLMAAVMIACAGAAHADPIPPERQPFDMLAAHAAARSAIMDLKSVGTPTPRDYRIVQQVLVTANRLYPNDQTMLRLLLESASGSDDAATIRNVVRDLVKLDPDDSVSLLRAISASISDLQTVDQRLAAYAKFLGDAGADLDPSVRSRLALDSALLLREQGNLDAFADRLSTAIELDPTNKDAATLALTFFSQRMNDPVGRFDLLLTLIYADPFDSAAYSAAIRDLLAGKAPRGAWRFANLQRALAAGQFRSLSEEEETLHDLAEWNAEGPEAVIRRLNALVESSRNAAAERRRQLAEIGQPLEGAPDPDSVRLPLSRDRIRLLCAASLGDRERATNILAELNKSAAQAVALLTDVGRRPTGMSDDEAKQAVNDVTVESLWLRLWTGLELDAAETTLTDLKARGVLDAKAIRRFDGWSLLRKGKLDEASAILSEGAASDPYCELGLAVLEETRNRTAEAVKHYLSVMSRTAAEAAGAYARARIGFLTPAAIQPDGTAAALESAAAGVPDWLKSIVESPRKVVSVEVEPLRSEIVPIERTPVRLRIQNVSPIPLAMGPDKPINTRFLFAPSIEIGVARLSGAEMMHVATADRRLRLLPNESVDVVVWPDMGNLSWTLEYVGASASRIRWRVLQGFELRENRFYEPGPNCVAVEVPPLTRKVPNRIGGVFESFRRSIEIGGPRELADTLLSWKIQIANPDNLTIIEVDRLMETLTRRFGSMDRQTKILTMCLIPGAIDVGPCARIDQFATQDTDEDVLAILLATRVSNKDDPAFTVQPVLNSPRLSELATLVRERLVEGVPTYASTRIKLPELMYPPGREPQRPAQRNPKGPAQPGDSNEPVLDPMPKPVTPPALPPDPMPIPSNP